MVVNLSDAMNFGGLKEAKPGRQICGDLMAPVASWFLETICQSRPARPDKAEGVGTYIVGSLFSLGVNGGIPCGVHLMDTKVSPLPGIFCWSLPIGHVQGYLDHVTGDARVERTLAPSVSQPRPGPLCRNLLAFIWPSYLKLLQGEPRTAATSNMTTRGPVTSTF